jgi:hypothetical protein
MAAVWLELDGERRERCLPEKRKEGCSLWVAPRVTWEWFPFLSFSQLCICDYTNSKLDSSIASFQRSDKGRKNKRERKREKGREGMFVCVWERKVATIFCSRSPLFDDILLNLMFLQSNCIHSHFIKAGLMQPDH